jgi:AraC-like DNA-binding protein
MLIERMSEVANPLDILKVSTDKWFELLLHHSSFEPWAFGFTNTPKDFGKEPRCLPEHVFYFVTVGAIEIRFEDHNLLVKRGSFIWIMPGVRHETGMPEGGKPFMNYFLRVKITSSGSRQLFRLEKDWLLEENGYLALPVLKQTIDEFQMPHEFQTVRIRSLLALLTSGVIGHTNAQAQNERLLGPPQRSHLTNFMLERMESDGADGVTPEVLADLLNLSPAYFARIFRNSFGMSPRHWIEQQRIHLAATLLAKSDLSLKEIARRVGYGDFCSFSRQFKQVTGIGPRAYRDGALSSLTAKSG